MTRVLLVDDQHLVRTGLRTLCESVQDLDIVGEAVRGLDPALKQKYSAVPWRQIAGMRNILVHDYFRINEQIVWETVETHLPVLKREIEKILAQLPEP